MTRYLRLAATHCAAAARHNPPLAEIRPGRPGGGPPTLSALKSGHAPMIRATKQSDLPRIPLGNHQIGVVLRG